MIPCVDSSNYKNVKMKMTIFDYFLANKHFWGFLSWNFVI